MNSLDAIGPKAQLSAKDFEKSQQFYQDLGFTLSWANDNIVFLHFGDHGSHGKAGFLLQRYYQKEFA